MVRQQLAEHAALADAARDQLRVLPAVVEDDDLVMRDAALERELLDPLVCGDATPVAEADDVRHQAGTRSGASRATALLAMPTCWSRWRCLPSDCSAGAIISSARLNSAMSR